MSTDAITKGRSRARAAAVARWSGASKAPHGGHGPIELVAIDLDGTLLRSDKRLSKRSVIVIREATRHGVHVVLASARPPRSTRQIYGALGLNTLQINYNGALIVDPPRGKHVHHQPLPAALATRVVSLARKVDPDIVVSVEILDKWYTDYVDETLPTETSKAFTPDFVGPLEAFLHVPVTKLMFLGKPARVAKVRQAVVRKFGPDVGIAVSDEHLLQVVHPEVDKGRAVARIARRYGVAQGRVMAIGDAPNDLGMLVWAGLGVAVENAWAPVRKAADVVVPSNDDHGVAYAIEKYVLRHF